MLFMCIVEGRKNIYCNRCAIYPDLINSRGLVTSNTVSVVEKDIEEKAKRDAKRKKNLAKNRR